MAANLVLLAKALHVVGFVSWFAGLFYLGRVLVNHAVAGQQTRETEREALRWAILHEEYTATAARVYRIIVDPAAVITLTAGFTMVTINPGYLQAGTPGWLLVKLSLIFLMIGYQHYTKAKIMAPMAAGKRPWHDGALRLWNEVPTFFLVSIPFLAVFGKVGQLNYGYLAAGVAVFSLMVWRGAVAYRKKRN